MLASLIEHSPKSNRGPIVIGLRHMAMNYNCPTATSTNIRESLKRKSLINPSQPCIQHQFEMLRWDDVTPELVPVTTQ